MAVINPGDDLLKEFACVLFLQLREERLEIWGSELIARLNISSPCRVQECSRRALLLTRIYGNTPISTAAERAEVLRRNSLHH